MSVLTLQIVEKAPFVGLFRLHDSGRKRIKTKNKKIASLSQLLGEDIGDLFYVLAGGSHQCLLLNFLSAAETTIAKPMELFSIRETSLDSLITQSVQILSRFAPPIGANPFFACLPHMPCDHFCLIF